MEGLFSFNSLVMKEIKIIAKIMECNLYVMLIVKYHLGLVPNCCFFGGGGTWMYLSCSLNNKILEQYILLTFHFQNKIRNSLRHERIIEKLK